MVAIKNMKNIPNKCGECGLRSGGYCYHKKPPYNLTGVDVLKEKPKDCPLVEIITCKDCKYTRRNDDNDIYCDLSGRYYDPDYFCAYAERR